MITSMSIVGTPHPDFGDSGSLGMVITCRGLRVGDRWNIAQIFRQHKSSLAQPVTSYPSGATLSGLPSRENEQCLTLRSVISPNVFSARNQSVSGDRWVKQ